METVLNYPMHFLATLTDHRNMMRADCFVRAPELPWSSSVKCGEKEGHNDSGISPGRSGSDQNSRSPPSIAGNTFSGGYPTASPDSGDHTSSPHSPNTSAGFARGSSRSPGETGGYLRASSASPYPQSPVASGLYPSSPISNPMPDQSQGSLERLKMALERSSALSGIFKTESESVESDSPQDNQKKEFPCPLCAYTTPYRHRYMEHVGTHYADKCTLCEFSGKSAADLRTHLAQVHNINDVEDLADPTDTHSDGQDDDDTPGKRNKSKNFKCKQCPYVTNTKLEFWEHTKTHIKAEKLLTCPKCPFVTEYKHHLEYHLRNHFGSKPFKCPKCTYSCVNKSMLNSHMKSHSNIYQYRCADCAYATKYCHSLKLHLRKYEHNPAMVLNSDGSPNPLPIIDVYGTRRGPKSKPKSSDVKDDGVVSDQTPPRQNLPGGIVVPSAPQNSPKLPILNNNNNNNNNHIDENSQLVGLHKYLYCTLCDFYSPHYEVLNQHMYLHANESPIVQMFRTNNNLPDSMAMKDYFQNMFLGLTDPPPSPMSMLSSPHSASPITRRPPSPLDLSKQEDNKVNDETKLNGDKTDSKKNRRKGKAYKLERPVDFLEVKMEELEETINVTDEPDQSYKIKIPEFKLKPIEETKPKENGNNASNEDYNCNFCDISFKDVIMYTMHMGYHGFQDPFTCNMCGHVTTDKVAFFLHIARSSHT